MVGEMQPPAPLLTGEDPSTVQAGDVELWCSVYAELLGTVSRLIAESGLHASELRRLLIQQRRLRQRLEYWQTRATDLGIDDSTSDSSAG